MVRKSERNKTKAGPDKSPEKSRKTVRQSRRRKKSSSDSEPGPDIPVEETKPEQKPSSEPLDTPKAELSSPKVEVKDSEATSSGVNRPKRRKQTLEAEPAAKPQSTDREWKEDETFWANSESVVETSEAKSTEDEGTLWKVQSANGSSGEIQKLKICRQKPADVSESSPSHVKDTSPCRKKSARLSHSETGKDSPQTSECEASGSAMTETETPSSTVPDQSEPVPADSTDARVETQEATSETMQPDVTEQPLPEPSEAGPEKQDLPTQSDEQTPSAVEEPSVSEQPEEAVVEEGNKTEETPNSTEDMRAEPVQTSSSRSSPEKEAPDSSTRRKQDGSDSSDSSSDTNSSSAGERGDRKRLKKRRRLSKSSGGAQGGDEAQKPESVETAIESVNDPPGEEKSENEVVEKQEQEEPPQPQEEEKMDCVEESKPAENEIVTPETEEPPQSEQQTKTENETAEEAKQTTGEKMEEEPPKESGEKTVEEEKEKPPAESKVDHSEKEEGEISPARDPPAAKDRIEKTTAGRTKIIINKPQNENTSKPTILKRVPVEAPPAQRKRRTVSKAKPKEQSIAISSTSLKLIVPEAKPLPLEEVDLSIEEEKEAEEEQEEEEPKPKRMVNLSKSRDIEIRVKNDVREVTKKEPIVMEKKVVKEEKPKETTVQPPPENHKVVRKISIVSDDAKKLTRSPSPASRKATAVLFITNLVRPFTAPQLRELLARTGTIAPNGFYIDKIKSKCYVKYTEVEMAVETRHALHGVRWPVNNPKTLKVEFASPEDMALVQELAEDETKKSESVDSGWLNEQAALKPARRVTAGVREWDLGKIAGADGIVPQMKEENVDARKRVVGEGDWSRNKERGAGGAAQDAVDNRRRERPHSPDHKEFPARKVKRRENDAPSKLLDDLFRKTKATPCIYWLPLNAAQIVVKEEMRRQHMAEHERRLAEIRKSEQSRRERERDRRKK